MSAVLRKYISLFLLSLFLFPLIEKEVHALSHIEISHCKASDKHFHELQHSCAICDFIVPVSTVPGQSHHDFSVYFFATRLFFFRDQQSVSASRCIPSLRAPPIA